MTSKENKVASALTIVGVACIAIGIISGLYYGMNDMFVPLGWGNIQGLLGFGVFINGLVWGIVFLGFAEIIKLLQGIFNQGEPSGPQILMPSAPAASVQRKQRDPHEVSKYERMEIEEFYSEKGWTVEKIERTEREDFFVVTVNGKKELVELGGFKPVVHPFEEK
ncbi:hypothetical protein [Rossellomorea sp. NS-SX7]|uniref:hypothetical protein n=1 Tax=Rossellomorea sp. NS-SX7 TaxID=3463856 RepID=UPI00405A077C